MHGENRYGIYWEEDRCIPDEIALDVQGQCMARILISVDDDILAGERQRLLALYEED